MTELVTHPAPDCITMQMQNAKHPAAIALRIVFVFDMSSGPFTVLLWEVLSWNEAVP